MCNRFHISHFHVFWSVVTRGCVFPAVLSNSCQKTTMADFRYKSLKSWKIDNIDLTQQFRLSIFTDFRYQSIKISWLLPIYIAWLLRVEVTMLLLAPKFPIPLPLLIVVVVVIFFFLGGGGGGGEGMKTMQCFTVSV